MTRLAFALLAAVAATPALAQSEASWPDRPVRLVVPFPAGSSSDIISRMVAQKFSVRFGQQFVVENRAGASGNLGADVIAKAAPDGGTIGLITASTHGVSPALGHKLPYDPVNDFKPISMIGGAPYVLVMYPGIAARTIPELIAEARAKPGKLTYGSAGLASLAHLAAALFTTHSGIEMTHVPYKTSAQSVVDLITGRLDMQFATVGPTLENIRDGKLRAVATTGARRMSSLPEVPTIAESGVAGYEYVAWFGLLGPAALPASRVTQIHALFAQAVNSPDLKKRLEAEGVEEGLFGADEAHGEQHELRGADLFGARDVDRDELPLVVLLPLNLDRHEFLQVALFVADELLHRREVNARICAETGCRFLLAVVHLVDLRPFGPRIVRRAVHRRLG